MKRKMKGTDIPNGFVIAGPDGKPLLIDFDRNGKAGESGFELDLPEDWVPSVRPNGRFREDVIVLVHYIDGEKYLVKALEKRLIKADGEPVSVFTLADKGILRKTAESVWELYMKGEK